ncbi:hypothetical protein ACFLZC_02630, partial [Patescibacteria group bacterium]
MQTIKKLKTDLDSYIVKLPQKTNNVYFQFLLKEGYFKEKNSLFGLKHLTEHYITRLMAEDSDNKLNTSASVGDYDTSYYLETTKRKAQQNIAQFLQILTNPDFSKQTILNFEKKAILNELTVKYNENKNKIWQKINESFFAGKSIYNRSRLFQIKNIKKFTLEDLEKFHKRNLRKNNLIILVGFYGPNKKLK